MTNKELDKLVVNGTLTGYELFTEEFELGSGSRETEKLVLSFPNGSKLTIDTFCSGSSENTCLIIEVK
jgi:hypothetical protein